MTKKIKPPNLFEEKIKPKIKDIYIWITQGHTYPEISKKLGLNDDSVLYKYKRTNKEFSNVCEMAEISNKTKIYTIFIS